METAAEGRFERRPPVREPMVIAITVEGYPPIVVDVPALEPGVTHDIGTVRLDSGRTAHARVVDDMGAPIQGAIVTIPEPWPDLDLAARTGKDGVFRLPLMPRRPLHLSIKATGYPVHFVVHETDGGTIALGRGGLLDVRLLGGDGKPMAGVHAGIVRAGPGLDRDRARLGAEADGDGRCRRRLQEGRWRVEIWSRKHHKLLTREVEVRSGETTEATLRFD